MKVLLVIDSDTTYSLCKIALQNAGADCIRYRNPIKAMDNIEEIAPDIMIIHTGDFPRHWKTITQFSADCGLLPGSHIVLIKTYYFSTEEQQKAIKLGIESFITEPSDSNDISQLLRVITSILPIKYIPATSHSLINNKSSFITSKKNPVLCLFTNPLNGAIVTGTIQTIGEASFTFIPDAPSQIIGIESSIEIDSATVKINGTVIFPSIAITPSGRSLHCTITNISADDKKCIESYLKTLES